MVELTELADKMMEFSRGFLAKHPDGELTPAVIMQMPNGETNLAMLPWRNDEEKAVTVDLLGQKMRAMGVTSYAFASEAWMVTRENGQDMDTPPSECADRVEVITVLAVSRAGEAVGLSSTIERQEGRVIATSAPTVSPSKGTAGRMAEMLQEPMKSTTLH